ILPLNTGAAGRVLLAFDPEAPARPEAMKGANGAVIVTIGEREPDIAAVAAPVFGPGNALLGAIAISGPASRFEPHVVAGFKERIRSAAIELTRRLGGNVKRFEEGKDLTDYGHETYPPDG